MEVFIFDMKSLMIGWRIVRMSGSECPIIRTPEATEGGFRDRLPRRRCSSNDALRRDSSDINFGRLTELIWHANENRQNLMCSQSCPIFRSPWFRQHSHARIKNRTATGCVARIRRARLKSVHWILSRACICHRFASHPATWPLPSHSSSGDGRMFGASNENFQPPCVSPP